VKDGVTHSHSPFLFPFPWCRLSCGEALRVVRALDPMDNSGAVSMCSAEQTKQDARKLVALRLRQLREWLSVSQGAVATHLGISHSTLSAYEIGTRAITADRLAVLAPYYRVSLPELFAPCPSARNQ
jgi:DNA-binding transcriptional regulator YiaG